MDSAALLDGRGLITPLSCPGARHCETADGVFRVGAGARTITPVVGAGAPVWLAGFGQGRAATGVHDDVWARAIVVERGATRLGLVVLDAVGLFHPDTVRIKQAAQNASLQLDDVIVVATHTHNSKDTMGLWGENVGSTGYDPSYQAHLIERATAALADAVDSLTDARLTTGIATAAQFVRDARFPEVRDDGVYTLHFSTADAADRAIATLVVWGNHPESLADKNTLVTSDYPHYLREELEAQLPGTIAVFAPGVLGGLTTPLGPLVCPDAAGRETCPSGTYARAEMIGRTVAAAAVASLHQGNARMETAPAIGLRRVPLLLTPTNRALGFAFALGLVTRPIYDAESGALLSPEVIANLSIEDVPLGLYQIDSELNAFSIGAVEIVTAPGELYAELWVTDPDGKPLIGRPAGADFPDAELETPITRIMRDAPVKIVLNQANDAVGYIIPRSQFDAEEPFAYVPEGQYGEENSIGPLVAGQLAHGVEALYALDPARGGR